MQENAIHFVVSVNVSIAFCGFAGSAVLLVFSKLCFADPSHILEDPTSPTGA